MLNVRKLAALDLFFLAPMIILVEVGLGAVGLVALGLFSLRLNAVPRGLRMSVKGNGSTEFFLW